MEEQEVGRVVHYWTNIGVAGIEVTDGEIKVGDTLHIKGHTSDFSFKVESIHEEDKTIEKAEKGQKVGIKVPEHAREHDQIFLVKEN